MALPAGLDLVGGAWEDSEELSVAHDSDLAQAVVSKLSLHISAHGHVHEISPVVYL
jgi:hypothetical protein